jgi:hypothetical protein
MRHDLVFKATTAGAKKKFSKKKTNLEIFWPDLSDIDRTDKCSGGSSCRWAIVTAVVQ